METRSRNCIPSPVHNNENKNTTLTKHFGLQHCPLRAPWRKCRVEAVTNKDITTRVQHIQPILSGTQRHQCCSEWSLLTLRCKHREGSEVLMSSRVGIYLRVGLCHKYAIYKSQPETLCIPFSSPTKPDAEINPNESCNESFSDKFCVRVWAVSGCRAARINFPTLMNTPLLLTRRRHSFTGRNTVARVSGIRFVGEHTCIIGGVTSGNQNQPGTIFHCRTAGTRQRHCKATTRLSCPAQNLCYHRERC